MKFSVSQNVVCLLETTVLTILYAGLLFAGAKLVISML